MLGFMMYLSLHPVCWDMPSGVSSCLPIWALKKELVGFDQYEILLSNSASAMLFSEKES